MKYGGFREEYQTRCCAQRDTESPCLMQLLVLGKSQMLRIPCRIFSRAVKNQLLRALAGEGQPELRHSSNLVIGALKIQFIFWHQNKSKSNIYSGWYLRKSKAASFIKTCPQVVGKDLSIRQGHKIGLKIWWGKY